RRMSGASARGSRSTPGAERLKLVRSRRRRHELHENTEHHRLDHSRGRCVSGTVAPGEASRLILGVINQTCSGLCADTWLVTCADARTHSINGVTRNFDTCHDIIAVGYSPASVLGQTDHEYASDFRLASVIRPGATHGPMK